MAAAAGPKGDVSAVDVDVLLHPELLSREFLKSILNQRRVDTGHCGTRDRLLELYLRHVIPLPQRTLPDNRWGQRMEKSRGRRAAAAGAAGGHAQQSSSNDHSRKRPPIVFDGSSSLAAPLKVKKPDGATTAMGIAERLKPPPAANLPNPIRKLSINSSSSSSVHCDANRGNLKREHNASAAIKSPEVKKKIQHVTWP